jgi:hypothetical protein
MNDYMSRAMSTVQCESSCYFLSIGCFHLCASHTMYVTTEAAPPAPPWLTHLLVVSWGARPGSVTLKVVVRLAIRGPVT